MYIGDIDIEFAAIIQVSNGEVHALICVPADAAKHLALHAYEPLSVIVEIEIIRTKIIGAVKIGVAIAIQITGADGKREMGFGHAYCGHVHLLEPAAARVMKKQLEPTVVRIVPALVHEMKHAAIARILRLWKSKDVQWCGFRVIAQ